MPFKIMLAPMEGVADAKFRTLCYRNGADLTFTEIARVANLARGKKGEMLKTEIADGTPTEIQLAGAKLPEYEKYLGGFSPQAGFAGFNLNLGCPSPSFLRQGIGAGMIKRVARVKEIIALVNGAGHSCSVKMRLGQNRYEKERGAYLNLIEKVDAEFFVVHPKTAEQHSSEPEDYSAYAPCIATGKKIVANGGIVNRKQIEELKAQGLSGAMIGRAAMDNPGIFKMLKGA